MPSNTTWYDLLYISEGLFTTDTNLLSYAISGEIDNLLQGSFVRIFDENNNLLFSRDSANFDHYFLTSSTLSHVNAPIFMTCSGSTKMLIRRGYYSNTDSIEIYQLPGQLSFPCQNNLLLGNNPSSPVNSYLKTNHYPNPTNNNIIIDYKLPTGISKGTIRVFDLNGKELKKYDVDNKFSSLKLSVKDLPSGSYFYILDTPSGNSGGKKFFVIH